MATLQDLQARIAKLQAQAEAIAKKESSAVLAKVHDLLERHGLTTADVEAFRGSSGKRRAGSADTAGKHAGAAKYADPKTGATWTGHGRAPAWIASAKDRNKFLIDGGAGHSEAITKQGTRGGNYARGPQAPKYRDPVSGATWSGRGPAPAWLARVEDRTAYLIAGQGESAGATGATPANKTSRKAVATKKVGAKKTAKKVASKKVAAEKTAAKKTASNRVAAKKSGAKKGATAAKKASAKSAPAKKAPAKKLAAKRAAAKKATPNAEGESQTQSSLQQGGDASAPIAE